jgi:hypothetical protein
VRKQTRPCASISLDLYPSVQFIASVVSSRTFWPKLGYISIGLLKFRFFVNEPYSNQSQSFCPYTKMGLFLRKIDHFGATKHIKCAPGAAFRLSHFFCDGTTANRGETGSFIRQSSQCAGLYSESGRRVYCGLKHFMSCYGRLSCLIPPFFSISPTPSLAFRCRKN